MNLQQFLICLIISFSFACHTPSAQTNPTSTTTEDLPEATLEDVGLNRDTIDQLLHLIRTTPPRDFRGLVVIKDGQVVIEEHFFTYWRSTIHDIRSAGKSITALLMGIAIEQGLVEDVEQKVYDFFPPDRFDYSITEEHRQMRIKDLLMMSSGLDADTDNPDSPGFAWQWVRRDDWLTYVLNLPMAFTPGDNWVYNDATCFLVGAIIEETSGMSLAEFAELHLFHPLGIKEYYWFSSPQGRTSAMGNLYISAYDLAKIGQLVLQKGEWQGEQLIPASWVEELSSPKITNDLLQTFTEAYGYFWYIDSYDLSDGPISYFYASGSGGNRLHIVPEANMVVCILSSAWGPGHGQTRSTNTFNYILRALE